MNSLKLAVDFKRNIYFGFCFTLLLLLLLSCSKKAGDEEFSYTPDTAKMISMASSGTLAPESPIQVRFVGPMVKAEQVGLNLTKNVFKIDPSVQGITKWTDRQTLIFIPSSPLKMREKYTVELDMADLFPQHKEEKLENFKFDFMVSGRELAGVEAEFQPVSEDNPRFVKLKGTISFTENVPLDLVQKRTFINHNRRSIKVAISGDDEGKIFTFESADIERTKSPGKFFLYIQKEELDLSSNFQKEYVLPALQDLSVQSLSKIDMGNVPAIKVTFSDDISPNQDINGLIQVAEVADIELKKSGKDVFITGNFSFGSDYTVTVNKGLRSRLGTKVTEQYEKKIRFEDMNPEMRFTSDGVFLPSGNQQKIGFQTVNLRRVKVIVQKVYESNLGFFLQDQQIYSSKKRNDYFNSYEMRRVGVKVAEQWLDIGNQKNVWLQSEIDLSKIIPGNEFGLFTINLSFERDDMMYENLSGSSGSSGSYWGDNYYNNPASGGYLYRHGNIFKAVVVSDLAITYKKGVNEHLVYVTDIVSSDPVSGAEVRLRSYQNQVLATANTDADGAAKFPQVGDNVFFVEARKGKYRSVIKLNEMAWNLSSFETGGIETSIRGVRAFIYTERGVYRPGDSVHVALVARNEDNTFAENHPVNFKLYNPKNQLVLETVNRQAKDGFYAFHFATKNTDPTGNYRAEFLVGSKPIYHTIKIETVVPQRLKVKLETDKSEITEDRATVTINLQANYLFGNPAGNLKAEINAELSDYDLKFPQFPGFDFSNATGQDNYQKSRIWSGNLNTGGEQVYTWQLPSMDNISSAISIKLNAKVYEKGGRSSDNDAKVTYFPYNDYVGLQQPDFDYGYASVGNEVSIPVVLVNRQGNAKPGINLTYRIYRNERYWWWEYRNLKDFHLRYKSDVSTILVKEGTITVADVPVPLKFTPENRGEYFIEVTSPDPNGHVAGFFMRAYYWGDTPSGSDAGLLSLKSDKKEYVPGETATIRFPAPKEGNVLVTVEKADVIQKSWWEKPDANKNEMEIKIPITAEMLPNAYATVSVIQPHSQTMNDRPLRMYGIIPLMVLEKGTRQEIILNVANELESGKPFDVEIQTGDSKRTQFTVAVVDEGLLNLTRYKTPNPWGYFYQKLKLSVLSYDIFNHVLGANKGDIFKTFSIGGGYADNLERDQQSQKAKRFKAVSMFRGPFFTDGGGYAKVNFTMPEYIGAVRVMVVSADHDHYGKVDKSVPVKTDLIVLPTLPRVLGPQEEFKLPVSVFTMRDEIKDVKIILEVSGPVTVRDSANRSLRFKESGDQDVYFSLETQNEVGIAKFKIVATSGKYRAEKSVELDIRPSSPRIYDSENLRIAKGSSQTIDIPGKGITGTNQAVLNISKKPKLDIENRLRWLIHYPYGCIEQTTSSVFPQLYLKDFIKPDGRTDAEIDHNINAGIMRLRRFQLPSGGFSYWPGNNQASVWGSSYAGHFLIEAKKRGYNVPQDLLDNWKRYQKSQVLANRDGVRQQIYRLFLLALSGEAEVGAMNLIRENQFSNLKTTEKWMLASSYKLAGVGNTANSLSRNLGTEVEDYFEFSGTYGSTLRDQAIILMCMLILDEDNSAENMYDLISSKLSTKDWYSTQTTGFGLLALGKYINQNMGDIGDESSKIVGSVELPGGKKVPFTIDELKYSLRIKEGFGQSLKINIDDATTLDHAFISLDWSGIPFVADVEDLSKNLLLSVEWLDEDGVTINPKSLLQGKTFYGHFTVSKPKNSNQTLEELALVQVLPSGWEVENTRLSGEEKPRWMKNWKTGQEEYLDIRDDRVMWFFDLPRYTNKLDFYVKLNAVTEGKFVLPPTVAETMYSQNYQARKSGGWVSVNTQK